MPAQPPCAPFDLAVPEHHAIALIGASGSGKSTLLRCIDLLEEIDDGDVLLDGEVITDPAVDPVAVPPDCQRRRDAANRIGAGSSPAPYRRAQRSRQNRAI